MVRAIALAGLVSFGARGGCILPCGSTTTESVVTLDGGTCSETTLDCAAVCQPDSTESIACHCAAEAGEGNAVVCAYTSRDSCGD